MTDLSMMVLDLAIEDFIGLWELAWRANTVERASGTRIDPKRLREEVAELYAKGFLSVHKGHDFGGEEVELDVEEAQRVIADPASWNPAATGEQHYRVTATGTGEDEYRGKYST